MDYLGNDSMDLSIEAEREVARTFMGRIEWEMILIGLGQFTTWIVTWVLVVKGIIPLLVGFAIALFTACNAYLPSHAGQHGHLSGGRKNLQWLDFWVGQISVIPLAQSHDALKATHLKHHAHTNDPDSDPDFFHGNAKSWIGAVKNVNVSFNDEGPAMKCIEKHMEEDPKFKAALEKGGAWTLLFLLCANICRYPLPDRNITTMVDTKKSCYILLRRSVFLLASFRLDSGRYKDTRFWTNKIPRFLNHSMQIHSMHHMYPRICHYDEAKAIQALKPYMIERGIPGAEHIPDKLRWNPVTYIKEVYYGR